MNSITDNHILIYQFTYNSNNVKTERLNFVDTAA